MSDGIDYTNGNGRATLMKLMTGGLIVGLSSGLAFFGYYANSTRNHIDQINARVSNIERDRDERGPIIRLQQAEITKLRDQVEALQQKQWAIELKVQRLEIGRR